MTSQWWAEPSAGEIVWCHFPDDINPRPKPRPALILAVFDEDAPQFTVRVAYGTSQRTTTLHRGEFSILRDRNPSAYEAAGLSFDTKFDLKQALDLLFTTEWFSKSGEPQGSEGSNPSLSSSKNTKKNGPQRPVFCSLLAELLTKNRTPSE